MRGLNFIAPAALGLLLSLGSYSCGSPGTDSGRNLVDADLAALMPPDATSLMGVDVASLKESPVYQLLPPNRGRGEDVEKKIEEFAARTGFDPREDVEKFLFASWRDSSGAEPPAPPSFLLAARGRFDPRTLGEALVSHGAQREDHRGRDVYSRAMGEESAHAHPVAAICFLDPTTALVGSREAVFGAIDRSLDGGPNSLDNSALMEQVHAVRSGSQLWGVSLRPGDQLLGHSLNLPSGGEVPLFQLLERMGTSTFTLDLTGGFDFQAEALCATEEDAQLLADAARGFVALGRLTPMGAGVVGRMLFDSIEVSESGATVATSMVIEAEDLRKIIDALPRHPG